MRVGFVTMEKATNRDNDSVGSSRIRAKWLYNHWQEAEEWVVGKKYDALIFQKVYWEEMMKNYTGIKILDICDPDWLEGRYVMHFADMSDYVTTSTQALADYIQKFTKTPVECIPDRVDLTEHNKPKKEHSEHLKSAVWFGYSHNAHYLEPTFDVLHENGITLTVISESQIVPKENTKCRVIWKRYDYHTLHEELIKHDVALMPDTRLDQRGKFKSNNKTLTCMALGLPVIKIPNDIQKLKTKEARELEGRKNTDEIKKDWSVELSIKRYKEIIEECKSKQ